MSWPAVGAGSRRLAGSAAARLPGRGGTLPCAGAARPPAPPRYLGVRAASSAVAVCACLVWEQRQIAVCSGLLAGLINLHSSSIQKVERRATAGFVLGADSHLQLVDLVCCCEQCFGVFFCTCDLCRHTVQSCMKSTDTY